MEIHLSRKAAGNTFLNQQYMYFDLHFIYIRSILCTSQNEENQKLFLEKSLSIYAGDKSD